MRILIFSSSFHPHKGGVETVVLDLANGLASAGHRIVVVTNRWPATLSLVESFGNFMVFRVPLVRLEDVSTKPSSLLKWLFSDTALKLLVICFRPNVLNIQCVGPNGYWSIRLAKLFRLPMVLSTHGERTNDSSGFYSNPANKQLFSDLVESSKAIVCVSEVSAFESIQNQNLNSNKVRIIPNAITVSNKSLIVGNRDIDIVFVGRLVFEKGVDTLIEAVVRMRTSFPTLKVKIIGDGPCSNKLHDLVEANGLNQNIEFCGQLERESISHLLSRSKILVLPSRRESFGIVLLEGAHAGCAIVATATGGIPSIIMNGENGLLFDVDSDSQLAQHLTDLLLNEKLRLGLIYDFYKVLPHYDVGNFVSQYESVFTSVEKQ